MLMKIDLKQIKLDLYPKFNHSPDYGWSFSSSVDHPHFVKCRTFHIWYYLLSLIFSQCILAVIKSLKS